MSTCGSCRHWRRGEDHTGSCELTRTSVAYPFGEEHSRAVAQPGRPGGAVLTTVADFGCVQWANLTAADIEQARGPMTATERRVYLFTGEVPTR